MMQETLSCDFTNTVDSRLPEHQKETPGRYEYFLAWAVQNGIIDKTTGAELADAETDPEKNFFDFISSAGS